MNQPLQTLPPDWEIEVHGPACGWPTCTIIITIPTGLQMRRMSELEFSLSSCKTQWDIGSTSLKRVSASPCRLGGYSRQQRNNFCCWLLQTRRVS